MPNSQASVRRRSNGRAQMHSHEFPRSAPQRSSSRSDSTIKPDVKKAECTYFAVSFPNFAMITPPLTVPTEGFEERLGCSIFSIPPSPKIWSVHGSMYDREGGCMSVRKASKDCVIFIIESAVKCYGQLTMTNITAISDFANLDIILEEDLPGGARRPSRQFQCWCQVVWCLPNHQISWAIIFSRSPSSLLDDLRLVDTQPSCFKVPYFPLRIST